MTTQASRYFRDADKSVPVYPHENDATTISPSRPAAESATMTLRQDALPATPGQRLPTWGSSASMPRSIESAAETRFAFVGVAAVFVGKTAVGERRLFCWQYSLYKKFCIFPDQKLLFYKQVYWAVFVWM